MRENGGKIMLHVIEEDLVGKELRALREKNFVREATTYREKMKEVIKEEIVPDTTYADGIVMECSTTRSDEIIHMTVMDLKGNVLIDEPINPYFLNSSFWKNNKNRVSLEDIKIGAYPHEMYVDLKRIINGTSKIIVYDQPHIQANFVLWRLDSLKVKEYEEQGIYSVDNEGPCENLDKIVDISKEFASIYGEDDINGKMMPQSLYTCYTFYRGIDPMFPAGDMYNALHRCDAIRECYLFMEEQKKAHECKILEKVYDERFELNVPRMYHMEHLWKDKITDGLILSGRTLSDEKGNTEVVRLSITDMAGELLFDSMIKPYVVQKKMLAEDWLDDDMAKKIAYGRYPHEVVLEMKAILAKASYVVTYDEALESVLMDWGDLIVNELDEDKVKRISGWFSSVYGEMNHNNRFFKEQSLYTCARTLGYSRYNELNTGDTVCECQAIAYCYKKMLQSC